MFIDNLVQDPAYYVTVVVCVTTSIVLHELGHGAAALAQGDDTPRVTGHMTLNPIVHMGPLGLGLLFIVGIAFGVMPVNPGRFRSPYGDAIVAAAGPLVNAVLAVVSLSLLAVCIRLGIPTEVGGVDPLWIMGLLNCVLALFNLVPVAPLDGSAVLANFVPAYRDFIRDPAHANLSWLAFGLLFFFAGELFVVGASLARGFVNLLLA